MTTYILGAGASVHAGYPLGSQLWARLAFWIGESFAADHPFRRKLELIGTLHGPVRDVEALLTDIQLGRGVFGQLTDSAQNSLRSFVREVTREYFRKDPPLEAPLYAELATKRIELGDTLITFNYELSLERQLRFSRLEGEVRKLELPDGYGLQTNSDIATSAVTVLKLHGSVNWLGQMFGGAQPGDYSAANNSLGRRPVMDPTSQSYLDYGEAPPVIDPEFRGGGYDAQIAMILPTLEKRFEANTTFGLEWREFWDGLWHRAALSLAQSSRIVMIGYSLREADVRAREMILGCSNKTADVVICCGSQSQPLADTFINHGFLYARAAGTFESWLRYG
jgi:hypothetical protein